MTVSDIDQMQNWHIAYCEWETLKFRESPVNV
jgi:hypothetical protein